MNFTRLHGGRQTFLPKMSTSGQSPERCWTNIGYV